MESSNKNYPVGFLAEMAWKAGYEGTLSLVESTALMHRVPT